MGESISIFPVRLIEIKSNSIHPFFKLLSLTNKHNAKIKICKSSHFYFIHF